MSIRNLVENKSKLDYQALTTSLISEFGITDPVNWEAVIPANVQQNLFGGETLRIFEDHPNFATQKDIRTIALKKGQTSQLLVLFAKLRDEKLSKSNIEKVTKKFIGGSTAERYVVWFLGNPSNTEFKVVLSGKEGKKIVLKTLPFGINQPYYKTYDFILDEVHKKVAQLFVEPNELWKALWKSFDISVVNKKFYLDIKTSFDSLINDKVFKGSIRIEEARKQFAVRLIGRIIFSWFLKKKNIIAESVLSSNAISKYDNYYLEFLEKLFFEVFNTPQKERDKLPNEIKDYPFLNGGLFEAQEGDYGDYKGKVIIDNNWFNELFKNTLEKYNFTIDENTSASSEIAIDPEMLGRIFENLLAEQNPVTKEAASDRKSTGSYYTPREIVDYMVEQSISEYLKSNITLSGVEASVIEDFVHTAEFPEVLKPYSTEIFGKLNDVKVLDPACGSGAFPIGMLQKLIALKLQLSPLDKAQRGVSVYDLKLQTILNSIYGCDIQPMAVELSRLRCWLSLIIDEEVDKKKSNWGIANLPNLDFKFVCVNTLIGLPPMVQDSLGTSANDFEKLKQLRTEFFSASAKRKLQIEKEFKELQNSISIKQREWSTKNTKAVTLLVNWNPFKVEKNEWFDPFWMFGLNEVFDIVIGNPPYGFRTVLSKDEKNYFRKIALIEFASGDSAELFSKICFNRYTKANGILTFIIPKKSLYGDAWEDLRVNYWQKFNLKYILDTSKSFANVLLEASVFGLKKVSNAGNVSLNFLTKENVIESFNLVPFQEILTRHNTFQIYKTLYPASLIEKIHINQTEKSLVQGKLGLAIGTDFFSDEPKKYKLLKGIDIERYKVRSNRFLANHQKLNWDVASEFLVPKVLSQVIVAHIENPNPHLKITACYDAEGIIITNTLMSFVLDDSIYAKFWLGYLNTKFVSWFAYNFIYCRAIRTMHFYNFYIQQVPIPLADKKEQEKIISVVEKIENLKNQNPQANTKQLEDQIDIMVYKLYNLTYEEVKIIDPEIEKIISKEDYEKFGVH
jgi:hypothetical protein